MSTKKSPVKKPKTQAPKRQAPKPEEPQPEAPATPAPTLENLFEELQSLKQLAEEHTNLIAQLQETLARKRKSVSSNGKVQILDKQTGEIFPSKNNAYQTLLKSGELKELVEKGVFGDIPQKNTFGWYALVRELPDRFEEVKAEEVHEKAEEPQQ